MTPASTIGHLRDLREALANYMWALNVSGQPGRFLPCTEGTTDQGQRLSLGFSCFALKVFHSLNLWTELPQDERAAWITFLKSFQKDNPQEANPIRQYAFVDKPVVDYLNGYIPRIRRLALNRFKRMRPAYVERTIIAETKQAIATLAEIGEATERIYRGYPTSSHAIEQYLQQLGWDRPWGAGSHAAALAVFLDTQAPRVISASAIDKLVEAWSYSIEGFIDQKTGAYFLGAEPRQEMLVNGAMKVLTGLDWLSIPVHMPERLIDTTLRSLPSAEGCNMVDAVYVLYRCLQHTEHRKADVLHYLDQVKEMIMLHHNPDGGFSYYVGRSQRSYYGVPITFGLTVSDIHGTCLLIWALAMISKTVEEDASEWRVIKP